jgi:putative ABC transport system substrate-binding protein
MNPGRRRLLAGLALLPLAARAAPPFVAVVTAGDEASFASRAAALKKALPGVKLAFHYGAVDAARIVASAPAVIVSASDRTTRPLRQATATIPIVMASAEDPVADRLVRSLEKPEGNVTGVQSGRRDEVITAIKHLVAAMPPTGAIGALLDQNNIDYRPLRARVHAAAQDAKRPFVFLDASVPAEIDTAFAALAREQVKGLVVTGDALYVDERARLVRLAAKAPIPVMFCDASFVRAGARMAYGGDSDADMTRAAAYVKKILAGAHPADLPVEPPPPFRLEKRGK